MAAAATTAELSEPPPQYEAAPSGAADYGSWRFWDDLYQKDREPFGTFVVDAPRRPWHPPFPPPLPHCLLTDSWDHRQSGIIRTLSCGG